MLQTLNQPEDNIPKLGEVWQFGRPRFIIEYDPEEGVGQAVVIEGDRVGSSMTFEFKEQLPTVYKLANSLQEYFQYKKQEDLITNFLEYLEDQHNYILIQISERYGDDTIVNSEQLDTILREWIRKQNNV